MDAPGVLANEFDYENDSLTVVLLTGPSIGTVVLNPDGSFVYVPDISEFGIDTFTYLVSDGLLDSNIVSVEIEVNGVGSGGVGTETGGGTGNGPDPGDPTEVDETVTPVLVSVPPESSVDGGATLNRRVRHRQTAPLIVGIDPGRPSTPTPIVGEVLVDFEQALHRRGRGLIGDLRPFQFDLTGYFQDSNLMWENFDHLQQRMQDEVAAHQFAAGAAAAVSGAATIGYVLWTVRGGFLMATLLSSLPVWRILDPIPILSASAVGDEDEESLEDLVVEANKS